MAFKVTFSLQLQNHRPGAVEQGGGQHIVVNTPARCSSRNQPVLADTCFSEDSMSTTELSDFSAGEGPL